MTKASCRPHEVQVHSECPGATEDRSADCHPGAGRKWPLRWHAPLHSSLPPRLPPIYSSISSLAHLTLGWEHSPPDGVQEEGHHRGPLSLWSDDVPHSPFFSKQPSIAWPSRSTDTRGGLKPGQGGWRLWKCSQVSPFLSSSGQPSRAQKACIPQSAEASLHCWALIHTRMHMHTWVPPQPLSLVLPSLPQCPPFQSPVANPPAVFTSPLSSLPFIPRLLTEHENAPEHTVF